MERTVTFPPSAFFRLMAASRACRSSGLMILSTPSLMRLPVLGSNLTSVVSGTCLIKTMMSIVFAPFLAFAAFHIRGVSVYPETFEPISKRPLLPNICVRLKF